MDPIAVVAVTQGILHWVQKSWWLRMTRVAIWELNSVEIKFLLLCSFGYCICGVISGNSWKNALECRSKLWQIS